MATLRNRRQIAAVSRETQESLRSSQSQNTSAPGNTEEFIVQVFEDIEGRVTKKLSQVFSRTASSILGALSKLDEFLLNPQVPTFSETIPGTLRSADVENQEPSQDRSQNDPHPEVEFSACCASNLTDSDPDAISHTVTRVLEEIPYCSPGTSSGKQKKERSISHAKFCSEITPAVFEAYQLLLALQQLANNNNSANFKNNINRISKLLKSLTTTMPIFKGKSEKIELFEDLFRSSLKIHNQLTEKN